MSDTQEDFCRLRVTLSNASRNVLSSDDYLHAYENLESLEWVFEEAERLQNLTIEALRTPGFLNTLRELKGGEMCGFLGRDMQFDDDSELPYHRMVKFIPVMNRMGYKVTLWNDTNDIISFECPPFKIEANSEDFHQRATEFWPTQVTERRFENYWG